MNHHEFHFLSITEIKFFEKLFNEMGPNEEDEITFEMFKEIVLNYNKFNRSTVTQSLDRIKRRIKDTVSSQHEGDLLIAKPDYFEYLEQICMEHDKMLNEKDPELKELFNLLTNDEPVLYKKRLIEIISAFDLPIIIDEFFGPLGKKEEITFSDFCSLFKSKTPQNDMFLRTFASSFQNSSSMNPENKDMFPIQVVPK